MTPQTPLDAPVKVDDLDRGRGAMTALRMRLLSRDGLVCALLLGVCILAIWPVAEVGINDDWVYTLTTLDLARTGHFIFHGWASPMLGWQAMWGAVFVKLFGPTFTAVRLSAVPVALALAVFYRAILRRFGLNSAHATFGTLTLILGPVFLALSATFMTDVPSLFAILVCLYLCQLAMAAGTTRATLLWLIAAGVTNIALGTVRQVAWLGVLVILPSCGWLLRRRRYVVQTVAGLWLAAIVCIAVMSRWFAHQPFTSPEKIISERVHLRILLHAAIQFLRAGTTSLLLLLPVLAIGLSAIWPLKKKQALRGAALLIALLVAFAALHVRGRADILEVPWLGNTLDIHGILQGDPLFGSVRTVPSGWLLLVVLFVVLGAWASIETYAACAHTVVSLDASSEHEVSWREISVLLLPFLIAYCVLLVPRAGFFLLFDRYLLEVLAVLLVFLLRRHQQHVNARIPAPAIAVLCIVATVSVAATHDMFSLDRAEVRAAGELQRAGIPRTEIRGGFAFDSVTQVDAWGYLNDPRIQNPAGAYRPQAQPAPNFRDGIDCGYPFHRYVPALNIRYVISADPTPCLVPSSFAAQTYRTWLPPARRQVFIGTPLPVVRGGNTDHR